MQIQCRYECIYEAEPRSLELSRTRSNFQLSRPHFLLKCLFSLIVVIILLSAISNHVPTSRTVFRFDSCQRQLFSTRLQKKISPRDNTLAANQHSFEITNFYYLTVWLSSFSYHYHTNHADNKLVRYMVELKQPHK